MDATEYQLRVLNKDLENRIENLESRIELLERIVENIQEWLGTDEE